MSMARCVRTPADSFENIIQYTQNWTKKQLGSMEDG